MPDLKISQLPAVTTPLAGTEVLPIVQAGTTKKVTVTELAASTGLIYLGTWNASTNTPTITSSVGSKGQYYIVSIAGSTNIDGITDGTKKNTFVSIKPFVIKNNIIKDNIFVKLINSAELYDKVMKQTDKNREEADILDVDISVIEKLLKLRLDKDVYNIHNKYSLFIYLLFTSGLRTNEVTENTFTVVDDITIKAQRISKKDNTDGENIVNLLICAEEWLYYFDILQNKIKSKNIFKVSSISSGIKRKLFDIHPDLHAHSLRKLYLSYHLQIRKTGADKIPSINTKRLLNHTNEAGSVFYTGVIKITGELTEIIDNTDYSKMKLIELKNILRSKGVFTVLKTKKDDLINMIKPR